MKIHIAFKKKHSFYTLDQNLNKKQSEVVFIVSVEDVSPFVIFFPSLVSLCILCHLKREMPNVLLGGHVLHPTEVSACGAALIIPLLPLLTAQYCRLMFKSFGFY